MHTYTHAYIIVLKQRNILEDQISATRKSSLRVSEISLGKCRKREEKDCMENLILWTEGTEPTWSQRKKLWGEQEEDNRRHLPLARQGEFENARVADATKWPLPVGLQTPWFLLARRALVIFPEEFLTGKACYFESTIEGWRCSSVVEHVFCVPDALGPTPSLKTTITQQTEQKRKTTEV